MFVEQDFGIKVLLENKACAKLLSSQPKNSPYLTLKSQLEVFQSEYLDQLFYQ